MCSEKAKNNSSSNRERYPLVKLGDILDKGGRGIDSSAQSGRIFAFEFLNYLDTEAEKYEGRVHYLIGNHEIMNIQGDFRYVHKTHLNHTGNQIEDIYLNGWIWLIGMSFMEY